MCVDMAIQNAYKALKSVRWHDFREVGGDEPYFDWYYAENQLYVIRDRVMEQYYFVKARSPLDALKEFKGRIDGVMEAGRWCEDNAE